MKRARLVLWIAMVAVALLAVPSVAVAARQLIYAANNPSQQGAAIQAGELYEAWQRHELFTRPKYLISHPDSYPYLECATPPSYDSIESAHLTEVFMVDADVRYGAGYAALIQKHIGPIEMGLLTGCLQASPFASICADRVRSVTYGNNDELNDELVGERSDAARANAYCAASRAIQSRN